MIKLTESFMNSMYNKRIYTRNSFVHILVTVEGWTGLQKGHTKEKKKRQLNKIVFT